MGDKDQSKVSAINYGSYLRSYSDNPADVLFSRVAQFEKWNAETLKLIVGTVPADGLRNRVAIRFLQTTLDHSVGISILLKSGLVTSALTLFRAQYETYIRGLFILKCATDVQLENFVNDVKNALPDFVSLNNAIDKKEGTVHFNKMRETYWKIANDWTHGGAMHILQGLTTDVVQSNYGAEDALGLFRTSTNLAVLAAANLALANGREDLAIAIDRRFTEIFLPGW
jgi:hypothetical protein